MEKRALSSIERTELRDEACFVAYSVVSKSVVSQAVDWLNAHGESDLFELPARGRITWHS
jgi:hypothetical protein